MRIFFLQKKKLIFERFFDFSRPAFGHGRLGHPQSLEYCVSSSYAKILGETNFHTREILRSGSKAEDGKERKRRPKAGNNNGQLRIAMPPRVAHSKPPGPKFVAMAWVAILGCVTAHSSTFQIFMTALYCLLRFSE